MTSCRLRAVVVAAALMGVLIAHGVAQVSNAAWVYPSPTGNLLYQLDERGQRIADFSHCGHRGGTEPLPNVTALIPQARWVYVNPGTGDDTALIQAAIDTVEAMTPDTNGWRGVVFLNAGEYQLASTVTIEAGGVVLKGAGDSPTTGTRLRATDPRDYDVISINGPGSRTTVSGTTHNLTQKVVPAGARTFEVDSAAGFAVGHTVIVKRPSTANWIADIDMDQLGPAPSEPWTAGSRDLSFDRVITRIDGTWITVDVPLPATFEAIYGGGQIWRYTWSNRIEQVGIEDLYGFSDYASSTDELHAWEFIHINDVQHCWVREITAQYFAYSAVSAGTGTKWLTVADSQCLDPISEITGGRRYSFNNEGAQCALFVNCYARQGRHDFVFGAGVPGPNAFVHGTADTAYSDSGPHHRWSVGGLFDGVTVNGHELNVQNRGNSGTGHGWAGGYMAVWNSVATRFRVRNPPTARNWLVGSIGTISASQSPVGADPAGTYDSSGPAGTGKAVYPRSLYYGQLQQRLKAAGSVFREVWLGDVDQHSSTDGAGEAAAVNAGWLSQVKAIDTTPADALFDKLTGNRRTAFTFAFTVDPGDTVVAGSLTVSLRAIGANSGDDDLRLDATGSVQTFASVGWTPISTTAPTVRTVEISPALLGDGRLHVAVGSDSVVDFAVLHLQVQKAQPFTQVVTLTPEADAYVRGGVNAGTNFGTATLLETKDITNSDVNREAFLRWNLSGVSGRLLHAKVRLAGTAATQVGNESGATFVSNDTWSETAITFNNKPAAGKLFAQWLPVTGQPVEFSVTPHVAESMLGDGKLSLRIVSTGNYGADGNVSYASRENGTAANRPQLILTFGLLPPEVAITSPADGAFINRAGPLTITADAQPVDGAITSVAFYDGAALLGTATSAPYQVTANFGGGTHPLTAVATDANGLSKTSLVTHIHVPYPPTAAAGSATTPRGTSIDIDLRPLVSDVETPDAYLHLALGAAANGTVSLLADGFTARFTPAAGYSGLASFSYIVTDTTPDARTLLHYSFQAGDASDSSGQGRNGTVNVQGTGVASFTAGAPAAVAPYTQCLALTENGTAGAARLERPLTTTELDLKNADWTVAGWFRRATATNQDTIVQLGDSGGFAANALTLAFYGTSATLDLRNFNGSTQDVLISKTNVSTGAWHHFAIVRSGTTLSLYVDGALAGSDAASGFSFDNSRPVKFGGVGPTTLLDRWLNGSLADLAVFGGALPAADVTRLATQPVAWLDGQTATAVVSVTVLSPIESWRQTHFGTTSNTGSAADDADPNGDSIVNKLEFFLARNPITSNPPSSLPAVARNGSTLEYTYTRSLSAMSQFIYVVEWSDTLATGSWSSAGVSEQILSANGTTQQVKASIPVGGNDRRFIHLKVQ